ncbi:hypothetical protein SARC_05177 [Sphaeroforma arctica JP610]|uniref:Uncharacterized protein n=1 Tax=Sphaeroforma arctica JP610 TaxID=667725 RepID=A0A0L0G121_9EUKA|nr:hypothetical protein SARC_05177 [Sphaeroforma arctica JP610]KNC82529.1 hypothetical protein SARC_05177 [Sphaeroforma arctica JP610]|eukprot:XP_014156431.1 hypothetical protein SARC_05177 [Sphaeroforma arctica JP610]
MTEVVLCPNQIEWLEICAHQYHLSVSDVLAKLVNFVNSESKERKRIVFTQIRCGRCTQATTGGKKATVELNFLPEHIAWLENVRDRCQHSSMSKTLRVMFDFYIPALQASDLDTLFGVDMS